MKVLLLGDSIRMFYQDEVKSQLGEKYEIVSPAENCRFSSYMLNSLRFWLNEFPAPDIIHFNAGLWDTAILYKEDGCFISVKEYVKNMKAVLRELKKTGAKIIFATTTPVKDEKENLNGPMPPAHKNSDIADYNKAILEAFKAEDIEIDDLFLKMYPERSRYLGDDMIHPNDEGTVFLGRLVADSIRKIGVYKNNKNTTSHCSSHQHNQKIIQ